MLARVRWLSVVAVLVAGAAFVATILGWLDEGEGIVAALGAVTLALLSREGEG